MVARARKGRAGEPVAVDARAVLGPVPAVAGTWQPYLDAAHAAGKIVEHRHFWELAVLFALQGRARRTGEATRPGPPGRWCE